jgi:hypothetical protein
MKTQLLTVLLTAVVSSGLTMICMSRDNSALANPLSAAANKPQPDAKPAADVKLVVDEHDMRTSFANAYRIHTTAEEVVIDFGFNMADSNPPEGEKDRLVFKVSDRVILSYRNLKRISTSLAKLLETYEKKFGEIKD